MNNKAARKIILPNFSLTFANEEIMPGKSQEVQCKNNNQEQQIHPTINANYEKYRYNLFPVVVGEDGRPWAEANIYIISKIIESPTPSLSTYHTIADDLAAFLRFLNEYNLDYSEFPESKIYRPTYRYRAHLLRSIQANEVALSTARRRMASIISFYRWMIDEKNLEPNFPPWIDSDKYINLQDHYGFTYHKRITNTDVSIKSSRVSDPYTETIEDGGKLKPLTWTEQSWLLEALQKLRNTEMTLIHLVALATGARIQTVLTLRWKHVKTEASSGPREVRILAGPGTGIDTKGNKRIALFFPHWLYDKLRHYSYSARAHKRRSRATGGNTEEQYLFLSIRGVPLYESKADLQTFNPANNLRHAKNGQGVRQFIRQYVIPSVQKKAVGKRFHYRFHDLRATYGMNLTDHQLSLVEENKATLHDVREFVKSRMGHSSAATTDLYLQYRTSLKIVRRAQEGYELYLKKLAEKVCPNHDNNIL